MAYGWDSGFVIEREKKKCGKRFNCKACYYYDSDDYSCQRRGLYIPSIGYNEWKYCKEMKFVPYNESSLSYVEQIVKAGKNQAIQHISIRNTRNHLREDVPKPLDIYSPSAIKDEYKSYFERINANDNIALECLIPFIPLEFEFAFFNYLCEDTEENFGALVIVVGSFLVNITTDLCRVNKYKVSRTIKRFKKACVNELLNCGENTINFYTISKAFILFYACEYKEFVEKHQDMIDQL